MKSSLLHLTILRRVLKPLTKVGLKDSSDLLLRCVLGCMSPLHQNHIKSDLHPYLFSFSEQTERLSPGL